MTTRVVLVTGANGYIGNAVARAFVHAGWVTYGLVRSPLSAQKLAAEEVIPVVGIIDSRETHESIREALPARLDVIVSTTESLKDYGFHFENTVRLLRLLSASSTAAGRQPMVIFTSGCKDYGIGPHVHGEAGPPPHTEETPLRPPPPVAARTNFSVKIFDHTDVFWPVLVRPTNVFGRGSTYYQNFLAVAEQIADQGGRFIMEAPPNHIIHALHVDDCADAYVAIASHPRVDEVRGQVFNISSYRYETVDEISRALITEYNIQDDPEYVDPKGREAVLWMPMLVNFPQWVDSTKLRTVTGWKDRRPLFSETLHVYRLAYEAAKEAGDEGVLRVQHLMGRVTRPRNLL
ncbi:unnamed protein product [Clonostachys rhizophaga]|uniref:NAD-dependent epimerase/dehydratase domain-containing protein n=1 Tax=Clonostachys rhizophaga TaxID=160324 RepID=A0A9N9YXA8_9HYPO|nr:unnamed protein product [Clonostachys rhizophaga]